MRPSLLPALAAAAITLASCSSYYFASPQPADSRDRHTLPRPMRGDWHVMEDEDTPPDPSGSPSYRCERKKLWIMEVDSLTAIDGMLSWTEASDTSAKQEASPPYLREQRRDTATGTLDTVVNFLVRGDRIYPVDDEGVGKGSPFTRSGDTLRSLRRDTTCHELGHRFRIRKADRNLWVLNFLDGERQEARGWWLILFVERKGDRLVIHSASEKMKTHPSLVGNSSEKYHFALDMRADDIRTMIRDSLFTPSLMLGR
jgi:hypothetical protein